MFQVLALRMQQLSYPKRFMLIGLLFALALGYLTFGLYRATQNNVEISSREQIGIDFLNPLSEALHLLAVHRHAAMSTGPSRTPKSAMLLEAEQKIEQHWKTTEALAAKISPAILSLDTALRQTALALSQTRTNAPLRPDEIMSRHDLASQRLSDLIMQVCDTSRLMLDAEEDSLYMVLNLCGQLPRLSTLIGEGSTLLMQTHGRGPGNLRHREIELRSLLADYQRGLSSNLEKAQLAAPALQRILNPAYSALRLEIHRQLDQLEQHILDGSRARPLVNPEHSLGIVRQFYRPALASLSELMQQRTEQQSRQRDIYLAIAILCLGISVFMFILLYISIKEQLGGEPLYVQTVIRKIAQGDLDTPILLCAGDRGSVLSDISIMRLRLQHTVAQLRTANHELSQLSDGLEAKVRERTSQLNDALRHAEAAAEAKSQFLANMSHEIRTPLNGILGMAELLASGPLDTAQRELVTHLRSSGDTLLALLNDILDLSKIEAGKLELEQRAFNLRREVESLIALHRPLAEERGLTLHAQLPELLPDTLIGDKVRLRQIVSNLLSNSVKFTDTGYVSLALRYDRITERCVRLHFTVTDTGIGIAPESIPRLFERFTQQDASTTRRFGGSGLGLAICAELIKAFQGEMIVSSQPGQGSCFAFSLDLPLGTPQAGHVLSQAEQANIRPMRILVAEDNSMNQKLVDLMLLRAGQRADLAENGQQAVELALQHDYDLILMDMHMPLMDGITATRVIKQQLQAPPRIVALTANAFEEDSRRCFDAGMDDFVSKPFQFETLLRILHDTQAMQTAADPD